jgi:UDP-GlcNAc3NAcA epimerase
MKIITLIGARPQIIKAAALNRAVKNHFDDAIDEIIVHTGQHYDENMSQVFINEMDISKPDYNLNVGSASHGKQTSRMIEGIEEILIKEKPDYLILFGDTNSTLAGAIAASKLHVPIAHIEAGLRSFNKNMPEEINRIMCDHTSTLLFCPTDTGIQNLIREGFSIKNSPPFSADNPGVFMSGDIMYDNTLYFKNIAQQKSTILKDYHLEDEPFILVTIHRDSNTDNKEKLNNIFAALLEISNDDKVKIICPLHPRTSKMIKQNLTDKVYRELMSSSRVILTPPISFFDITMLESKSKLVITDSGGVQKEAYFLKKPVIILRNETEWKEITENGCGIMTGANSKLIINAYKYFIENMNSINFPEIFGDGKATEFICKKLLEI